jgi:hypothetical protein
MFRDMARVLKGEIEETPQLGRYHAAPASPIFKGVFHTKLSADEADSAIHETVEWFKRRNAPFFFWWTGQATHGLLWITVLRGRSRRIDRAGHTSRVSQKGYRERHAVRTSVNCARAGVSVCRTICKRNGLFALSETGIPGYRPARQSLSLENWLKPKRKARTTVPSFQNSLVKTVKMAVPQDLAYAFLLSISRPGMRAAFSSHRNTASSK